MADGAQNPPPPPPPPALEFNNSYCRLALTIEIFLQYAHAHKLKLPFTKSLDPPLVQSTLDYPDLDYPDPRLSRSPKYWTTGLKIYLVSVTTTKSYCQAVPISGTPGHLSCAVQPVYSGYPSALNQLQGCTREGALGR